MRSLLFVFACCLFSVAYSQYHLDHPVPNLPPSVTGGIVCGSVNGKAILRWNDTLTGTELYAVDLAQPASAPVLLADLAPGQGSSNPELLTPNNGSLWFCLRRISGTTFWKTDGTPGGTVEVLDSYVETDTFFVVGNNIFTLDVYKNIWKSNILTQNTVKIDSNVRSIDKFKNGVAYICVPGSLKINDGTSPVSLSIDVANILSKVYGTDNNILLSLFDSGKNKILASNGTPGNLHVIYTYNSGQGTSSPAPLYFDNSHWAFFAGAATSTAAKKLLKLDCDNLIVTSLFTFSPGYGYPLLGGTALTDSGVVLIADSNGYRRACIADGAATTVSWIPALEDAYGIEKSIVKSVGNHTNLYCCYESYNGFYDLMMYDYTQYKPVEKIASRSDYFYLYLSGNNILYLKFDNLLPGYWNAQTGLATPLAVSPAQKPWFDIDALCQLTPNKVLISGNTDLAPKTTLYASDGTRQGTTILMNSNDDNIYSHNIIGMTPWKGKVYFTAFTPGEGNEPWVSDGTSAGTHLLKDLVPGADNPGPLWKIIAGGNGLIWHFRDTTCWLYQDATGTFTDLMPAMKGGGWSSLYEVATYGNATYFIIREARNTAGIISDSLKFFTLTPALSVPVQICAFPYTPDPPIFSNQFAILGSRIIDLQTGQSHIHPASPVFAPTIKCITTPSGSFFASQNLFIRISAFNKIDTLYKAASALSIKFGQAIDTFVYIGLTDSLITCNADGTHLKIQKYKFDKSLENKIFNIDYLFLMKNNALIGMADGSLSNKNEYIQLKGDSLCHTNRIFANQFSQERLSASHPSFQLNTDTLQVFASGALNDKLWVRKILPDGRQELLFGFRNDSSSFLNMPIARTRENDSLFYFTQGQRLYRAGIDAMSTTFIDSIPENGYLEWGIADDKLVYWFSPADTLIVFLSAGPGPGSTQQIWSYHYNPSITSTLRHSKPIAYHGKVYWLYWDIDSQRIQLMATDGTPAGTGVVKTLAQSIDRLHFPLLFRNKPEIISDTLFIQLKESEWGVKLWRSDGTPAGTTLMAHIMAADSSSGVIESLTPYKGKWYALYDHDIWQEKQNAFLPRYRPCLIRINPGTGQADSLLALPASSAAAGMFTLRDSLFILTTTRPIFPENASMTLWRNDGGTQLDSFTTLINKTVGLLSYSRANGRKAVIHVIDSIIYFALPMVISHFRSNGTISGTIDVDDFFGFVQGGRSLEDYSQAGNSLIEFTFVKYFYDYNSNTYVSFLHINEKDSIFSALPYAQASEANIISRQNEHIRNKIYSFGTTDARRMGISAYYIPVWETLPGSNVYSVGKDVKGGLWHYCYEDVHTILGINTNGLDLGTVTVEMDDRLQPEVIDSVSFAPRHFAIHCAGGPDCPTDGVLAHPIRVQLYFADAELDSLNAVTGLPNPIHALDVVRYNGIVNDCNLTNNPLPGFTDRIPSTQVKARDWMYGFSLEFSTPELGEFAVTNDLVFNSVAAPIRRDDALQVWPNPAQDRVHLTCSCGQIQSVSVVDISGKEISTAQVAGALEHVLSVAELHPGVYIIRAETACGTQSALLVKGE